MLEVGAPTDGHSWVWEGRRQTPTPTPPPLPVLTEGNEGPRSWGMEVGLGPLEPQDLVLSDAKLFFFNNVCCLQELRGHPAEAPLLQACQTHSDVTWVPHSNGS